MADIKDYLKEKETVKTNTSTKTEEKVEETKNEEIVELIKSGKVDVADIVDSGICSTCFDKKNNHILYGDNTDKMIFENDKFECFLVGNPRANGHVAISTKKHFKDMMEIDDETCKDIFLIAKKLMNLLKEREIKNDKSEYRIFKKILTRRKIKRRNKIT